jgi:hypothetical protein
MVLKFVTILSTSGEFRRQQKGLVCERCNNGGRVVVVRRLFLNLIEVSYATSRRAAVFEGVMLSQFVY